MGIPERLKEARNQLGLKQGEMAAQSGVSARAYQGYEAGRSVPGGDAIQGFVRVGINSNWLLTGEGEMLVNDLVPRSRYDWDKDIHAKSKQETELPSPISDLSAQFASITRSSVEGIFESDQIVDHISFRADWVRTELNADPANLILITAIGDSMEPTIHAGDLLLIDRSSKVIKQDAIYCFAANDNLRVKRIQLKLDGSFVISSDNAKYEPELLTADDAASLKIIGCAIWSGRRL
jgi:phage repressor protein C with HTH and peptisase S24 domain